MLRCLVLMTDPTFLPPLETYRSLVADAAEGLTVVDGRGTIVFENSMAARFFGWDSGVGRNVFERVDPSSMMRLRDVIADALADADLRNHTTVRVRHGDDAWLTVRSTCHAIQRQGSAPLAAVHWIDVSEYEALETRLRHMQKQLTLGRMIAAVAEDLDVALATIRLHLVALLESKIDELRRFRLRSIARATGAATVVASTLRSFARMAPVAADRIDVNVLLRDIRTLVGDDVSLKVTTSATDADILIDRQCLQDALVDLVRAFHYAMPPNSAIALSSSNSLLTTTSGLSDPYHRAHVVIEVVNTGRAGENGTMWSEPWAVKPASGAIMLSLAILEDAVGYFGGFVEVISTAYGPTTVRVWLPVPPGTEAL
jgi:PAS domain S-box-containing protein